MSLAGLDAQTSKHQMKAIDNQYHTNATFHTLASPKNLQHTSQTSSYGWDSQDDCGNPYADSTVALLQASGFGSPNMAKQILQHSVLVDGHMRSEFDTLDPKCA